MTAPAAPDRDCAQRRLILMRHADAERGGGAMADIERALTPEGVAEARRIGRALAEAGLAPDRALVSTARRARETWTAVSEAFPDVAADFHKAIYEASPATLWALAQQGMVGGESLILVGHNPGMQALAASLARGGPPMRGFPTGAVAVFGFAADDAVALERFLTPDEVER